MKYRPLKDYVARRAGIRLAFHPALRDRLVDMAVEEFPADASAEHVAEVLKARMARRVRGEYGSVIAMLILGAIVNVIVRLIVEWWLKRNSHRVLMAGWNKSALAPTDIPPPPATT